ILVVINRKDRTWQIGWVSVADGAITVIKSLDRRLRGNPSLSPDGKYIAYSALVTNPSSAISRTGPFPPLDSTGEHLYILAADGSVETELTKAAGTNRDPIWTPDGAHLLFISDRYGSLDLWSVPVQGGKSTGAAFTVKRDLGNGRPIGMTRAGSYYYIRGQGDIQNISIVEMEPGGGRVQGAVPRIVETLVGAGATWSPDGKVIAFQRPRLGGGSKPEFIRVVHSFETGEERVYDHPGIEAGPARWLSDSTGFLEKIQHENGTDSFYRVDMKSGEFREFMPLSALPNLSSTGILQL